MTEDHAPKPRKRRKEERPAEIIAAGLLEFAEKGFAGTRLDDVAARAGIVKGTIYRYFTDKDALFEAALHSRISPVFDDIERGLDAFPGSAEQLLKSIIPQIYREMFKGDLQILMRIIITEGGRHPHIAGVYYTQSIAKGRRLMEAIIRRGIARGEFRDSPATRLPMILVAPAIMAMVWKMTFDHFDPIAVDVFLEAHLDLVLSGIRA
jgi:AcrR family transcriptional regulator